MALSAVSDVWLHTWGLRHASTSADDFLGDLLEARSVLLEVGSDGTNLAHPGSHLLRHRREGCIEKSESQTATLADLQRALPERTEAILATPSRPARTTLLADTLGALMAADPKEETL